MRIDDKWYVAYLRTPMNVLERITFIKEILNILNKGIDIYILHKPSAIYILLKGIKTRIALGPLTIVFKVKEKDFVESKLKQYFKNIFKIGDNIWVDVLKPQPEIGFITENKDLINMLLNIGFKSSGDSKCLLIEKEDFVNDKELKEILYKRFTLFTKSLVAVKKEVIDVKGNLTYYYVNHPLFYGTNIFNTFLRAKILILTGNVPRKLNLISLPIAFINSYPLIYEVQYNKSIILNFIYEPNDLMKYLIISSCLYTCSQFL